ncbi:ABC transporter ATP-binding protein [Parasulfitobacter algicola]|uniref:ABC transporter ATP-binding protein n=1 Tax=Parasulfitobacter algicola TaxID=2614809 RepID=A0ABX2IZH8_9RHOB|nr:ABC transporter ATP-binding protein [Sulfitobacter algicola]NSX56662.1 ABC transporter ATP-binding protein [Sulfitobacter algicola]
MTLMSLDRLTVLRGECPVVDDVNLTVEKGDFIGLLGPNGAGKTTLMRGALGLVKTTGASSILDIKPAARAHHVAWLPQSREIAWPIDVETIVSLGRIPHGSQKLITNTDRAVVDRAIKRLDLTGFEHRIATRLSGGEQARVLIARALAQDTPLILADEVTAGLDPAHQISVMQIFQNLAAEGKGIVASIHDLGLAARHCTRLVLMHQGKLVADGAPTDVLTPENVKQVFGVESYFVQTDHGPIFQPVGIVR